MTPLGRRLSHYKGAGLAAGATILAIALEVKPLVRKAVTIVIFAVARFGSCILRDAIGLATIRRIAIEITKSRLATR